MAMKREVYKVKFLTEKNIIAVLLHDIQEALKDLLGGIIKEMLESEMDGHLGYDKYECSEEMRQKVSECVVNMWKLT